MTYYNFLNNIPNIPYNLIYPVNKLFEENAKISRLDGIYNQHRILNNDLHDWIKNNIPYVNFTYSIQRITNELPIHTDIKRTQAVNYIIQTGGENIFTNFHNNDNSIITSVIIPKNQWCYLNVGIPHSVTGKFTEDRIGLTITLDKFGA